jgi:Fungal potassium channel
MTLHSSSSSRSRVSPFGLPGLARVDRAFLEWKRLLLADGPRQSINALTLYSFYLAKSSEPGPWWQISKYMQWDQKDMVTDVLLVSMAFTVLIFIGSLLLLIVAAILYVPLLCYIRGNLKEYCCHKVDKARPLSKPEFSYTNCFIAYHRNYQAKAEATSCSTSTAGEERGRWRLFASQRKRRNAGCFTTAHASFHLLGR